MATLKQRSDARKNIKQAASTARKERTITNLPKAIRIARSKQAANIRNSGRG